MHPTLPDALPAPGVRGPAALLAVLAVAGAGACGQPAGIEATGVTLVGGRAPGSTVRGPRPEAPDQVAERRAAAPEAALGLATPSEWPLFRGGPGLPGVAAGALPERPRLLWSFEAGGAITSSPVVAEGRVYFGSDDGHVYALDARSGESLWAFETGDMIEAPPLVLEGTVFVGSSDFFFYALDARDGSLRWKVETDDKIVGGANVHRGPEGLRVLVGSHDANLYCFAAADGELLWAYATDNFVNATPAVTATHAVFGGCDAVLHMVDLASGERTGRVELGPDCHVAGSVAIEDGRAYFGHYGNRFVAVDLEDQELAWEYGEGRFPFFSSPALGTDRIVFGGRDRSLHCVRKADGVPLWTFKTRSKVDGSPVIAGERVLFGSQDGRLYLLDLADGRELWSFDVGKAIVSSPAVVEERFYVGANDGRLYAFGETPPGGAER